MPFIELPLCPSCGEPIPTDSIWGISDVDRWGFLRGPIGYQCNKCFTMFELRQTRIALVTIGLFAASMGMAFLLGKLSGHDETLGLVAIAGIVAVFLFMRLRANRLATFHVARDPEALIFPLGAQLVPTASNKSLQRTRGGSFGEQ